MDFVTLSRIQFGFTVGFHFLFPPMSIGIALFLVIMEGLYLKTKNPKYKEITKFWTKVFALIFALGIATGLVQVLAFGNNWSRYSSFVGDVFGSALGAEGIFAFFLESGFLGVMLFGWDRVRKGVHYMATILVCAGSHFSAVWIIIANSWMQTPAGFKLVGEGASRKAVVTNWWDMMLNPSAIDRLIHVIIACWLTGAFVILSVSAYYVLRKRHEFFAKKSMKVALWIAGVSVILQVFSADSTARGVLKNQPAKLAAIEGVYKTQEHTPMTLIGYVDTNQKKVVGLKVPGLLSFLCYRNFETAVPGLEQVPESDWPNVAVVFQTYHMMIYMWGMMVLTVGLALFFKWRKKFETSKWTLRLMMISVLFPQIANLTGWTTAEMGRQPWVVWQILRTADGVSKSIIPAYVIGSLIMFVTIYSLLFCLFIFLLNRKIQHGPEMEENAPPTKDDLIYRDIYQQ